ncbi:MAG: isoprenyl transferase [Aquiluna sp.]|nr:isoprenyl transferase [Aquiluna sp.]MCF8545368.1 isoprenyl transferase [Aquiluna sp.]
MRKLIYRLYEHQLEKELKPEGLPKHIGVMVDGNRRWAVAQGLDRAGHGHAAGARKIEDFLGWCADLKISHVTLYLLSTDNLKGRDSDELADLIEIIVSLSERLADLGKFRLQVVGDMQALPEDAANRLQVIQEQSSRNSGLHVNLAVAYGGRKEIADAMRSILRKNASEGKSVEELAELLTPELIADHLYTGGQPDPDLLIRTSGEQRLSGFLLWQSANSEFYFAEAMWPDFRRVDFLRAMRNFQRRHRRFGS